MRLSQRGGGEGRLVLVPRPWRRPGCTGVEWKAGQGRGASEEDTLLQWEGGEFEKKLDETARVSLDRGRN